MPGLDGVRAVAVALVVLYHLGVPGLGGGLLGVGVFFTLSGYLITSVLLATWQRTRETRLGVFYIRRARRLLPALVVLIVIVLLATCVVERERTGERLSEAFAALIYVANWQTISQGESYFEQVAGPGPLDHLWSLSVEEQFYLVWPLLLLAIVVAVRGRLRRAAVVTTALAAVSFALLWVLASPGLDTTRAYEGTDTRAGGLLLGAAVAMVWRPGRLPLGLSPRRRLLLDGVGLAGLAGIGLLATSTDEYSTFLYRGGILLLSVATAALVAAVSHPQSRVGAALGVGPLRWVGERSYGIYLWHVPVIAFTPQDAFGGQPAVRGVVQVALTLLVATLSWNVVESPIRRKGFLRAFRHRGFNPDGTRRPVPAAVAGTLTLLLVGTSTLSASALTGNAAPLRASERASGRPPVPADALRGAQPGAESTPTGPAPATGTPAPTTPPALPSSPTSSRPSTTGTTAPVGASDAALRTRCTSLVHVGDSTSVGLVDKAYQPNAKTRIDQQYKRIGISSFTPDILGARSIVERYHGQPNAEEAVTSRTGRGYDGCWVLAMGTNEVANQYAGGVVPLAERIDRLMRPIGDRPVLWLTVRTLRPSGPWGDAQMQKWNQALADACTRYPNMRVYDWRSEVKPSWFIDDGIHFTSKGYVERGKRIADAFARAFPASGASPSGCLVRSGD